MSLPACSLSLATSFKSETASRSGRGGGGRGEAPPRGRALHAVEATHVHTKRINASPRALRPRLRRIAGRRRRHGHVLEEDGRLRLEIARERRRREHCQRDHKNHNEQRARREAPRGRQHPIHGRPRLRRVVQQPLARLRAPLWCSSTVVVVIRVARGIHLEGLLGAVFHDSYQPAVEEMGPSSCRGVGCGSRI